MRRLPAASGVEPPVGQPEAAPPGRPASVMMAGLVVLNMAAWGWAAAAFYAHPALLGTALLAWMFGLRHAVDADHIAAIDNVVRKLMRGGGHPYAAGLWFSLGHSTVVVLACGAVAAAASSVQAHFGALRLFGGVFGTLVSAGFLLAIALANSALFWQLWRGFQHVRKGAVIARDDVEHLLAGAGLLSRVMQPAMRLIAASWQMYPLGFLFGLGFDTATEVGVLGISASQTQAGLSIWHILVFPALFTAAMALIDSADSVLMVGAYGWANVNPLRKIWYNLTMTGASVFVALLIGGVETLGLLGDQFALSGPVWGFVARLNHHFGALGLGAAVFFAACWAASYAAGRLRFLQLGGRL